MFLLPDLRVSSPKTTCFFSQNYVSFLPDLRGFSRNYVLLLPELRVTFLLESSGKRPVYTNHRGSPLEFRQDFASKGPYFLPIMDAFPGLRQIFSDPLSFQFYFSQNYVAASLKTTILFLLNYAFSRGKYFRI